MKARVYLVLIAVSFLVSGVAEGHMGVVGRANEVAVAHLIFLAFFSFAWCKADVEARNIKEPGGSALWVALLAPIGVPLYFFRSQPSKVAAISTIKALAYFALCAALYIGGTYVGQHVGI